MLDTATAASAAAKIEAAMVAAAVGLFVAVKAEKPFIGDLDSGKSGNPDVPSSSFCKNT